MNPMAAPAAAPVQVCCSPISCCSTLERRGEKLTQRGIRRLTSGFNCVPKDPVSASQIPQKTRCVPFLQKLSQRRAPGPAALLPRLHPWSC